MQPPTEDIVAAVLGNWGRWQRRSVFLIYLCKIPSAWFMACILFTAPTPRTGEFYCRPPGDGAVASSEPGGPAVASSALFQFERLSRSPRHDNELNLNYCVQRQLNASDGDIPCTQFEHSADFQSLVTQFDLVCSKTILIAVTQFFHLFGVLVGGILAVKLLEIQSPRYVMLIGMLTQIFCGCITGLTNRFEVHIFFRFLSAVCCAQMYTAGQMIFTDITGGRPRSTCICLFETFWSLGVILLPLHAFILPDWSSLYLLITLPTCFYSLAWLWIPDSPRWLLRHGQTDEARILLQQAAQCNGLPVEQLPADLAQQLQAAAAATQKPAVEGGTWWSLWRGKTVAAVVAAHIAWPVFVTNYNGMLLNVKAYGRDYLSLNTIVFGVCEIVGVLIGLTLIYKSKRKWVWAGFVNIVTGLCTYLAFLLPGTLSAGESTAVQILIAGLAKVAVSVAQSMLFTCTGELVAPEKRPVFLLSCVVWARLWLLGAPFIGALAGFHQSLSLAAFGTLSVLGGVAVAVLPRKVEF